MRAHLPGAEWIARRPGGWVACCSSSEGMWGVSVAPCSVHGARRPPFLGHSLHLGLVGTAGESLAGGGDTFVLGPPCSKLQQNGSGRMACRSRMDEKLGL